MAETTLTNMGAAQSRPAGWRGVAVDWASDQRAFKNVSWGKAMMWIFLLSDTFVFGCFLLSYMTARMSTTVPWPNPSEVFALHIGGTELPLLLIAIMTFVLISSSGTMAMAVNYGYPTTGAERPCFWCSRQLSAQPSLECKPLSGQS